MGLDVSAGAWITLLHAEVAWLLRDSDIDALLIKGLSTSEWLSGGVGRTSVDVDVLVAPTSVGPARAALEARGFRYAYEGMRADEPAAHSLVFSRSDPDLGGHEVDLHVTLPGAVARDPGAAWAALWSRRVAATVGGIPVWFPDVATRALLVVNQAARDGRLNAKSSSDLSRAIALLQPEAWTDVAALARQVGMAESVRAGLETTPDGVPVAARVLADVQAGDYWRLRAASAHRSAGRLVELGRLRWRDRPAAVARIVVPSPAMMRLRDPGLATRGRRGLAAAYFRRLGQGVATLPAAVRQVHAMRRGH